MQLAITARDFGFRPSSLFKNFSAAARLDFDLAASFVLLRFDNKRDEAKSNYLVSKIGDLFNGTQNED